MPLEYTKYPIKINHYTMYLISLIGWSGSGKWYLAEKIIAAVGADKISTIPMDMYYFPHDRFPPHLDVALEGKTYKNFDTPEALEIDLLVEHLTQLQSGKSVQIPHYDFWNNTTWKQLRTPWDIIEPRDFIILDGIFGLVDERIRAMTDVAIFIDISPLNRMARRFVRDFGYGQTRAYMGSGLGDTIKFYLEFVEKGYQNYVEKYKSFANIVVNNDTWVRKDEEPKMVDITVNYLRGKYEKQIEGILLR